MNRSYLFLLVAALLLPALLFTRSLGQAPNESAEPRTLFADYKTWKPVTERPVPEPPRTLCAPGGQLRSPHIGGYISVYVSPNARDLYIKGDVKEFPEGTVIVKEKLKTRDDEKPAELGVMIKGAKGSSAETHDWSYAFLEANGSLTVGQKLNHCARCHAAAKTDCTFRTNLEPAEGRPAVPTENRGVNSK